MSSTNEILSRILLSESLDAKLESLSNIDLDEIKLIESIPLRPARPDKIKFSEKQLKFPKAKSLSDDNKKALALNSFANHELLAIEMMVCALLYYPLKTKEDRLFKKGILQTIQDEQKHFSLYRNRMNDLGYDFGDFPINGFFWSYMDKMKTPSEYSAIMSLTFEAANLDFASYYRDIFKELGDEITADIMDIVYKDEISHVALGGHYLNIWKKDKTLWQYYNDCLPFPLTPARSKGIRFQSEHRRKCNLGDDFVSKITDYQDNFKITNRSH